METVLEKRVRELSEATGANHFDIWRIVKACRDTFESAGMDAATVETRLVEMLDALPWEPSDQIARMEGSLS